MRSFLRKLSYVLTFFIGSVATMVVLKANYDLNDYVSKKHCLPWMRDD